MKLCACPNLNIVSSFSEVAENQEMKNGHRISIGESCELNEVMWEQ